MKAPRSRAAFICGHTSAFHTETAGNPLEGWTLSDAQARARPRRWQTGEYTRTAVRRPVPQAATAPSRLRFIQAIQGQAAVHTNHKKGSKNAEPDNLGAAIAWERQRRQPRVFGDPFLERDI